MLRVEYSKERGSRCDYTVLLQSCSKAHERIRNQGYGKCLLSVYELLESRESFLARQCLHLFLDSCKGANCMLFAPEIGLSYCLLLHRGV